MMGNRPYTWTGEETHKYDDIIDLPHPVSARHSRMRLSDRAAQFSPYAALVGYADEISEVSRLTEDRAELTDEEQDQLNQKLILLGAQCDAAMSARRARGDAAFPTVTVTRFCPDPKKEGGAYTEYTGTLKRIETVEKTLVFANGDRIPLADVMDIMIE